MLGFKISSNAEGKIELKELPQTSSVELQTENVASRLTGPSTTKSLREKLKSESRDSETQVEPLDRDIRPGDSVAINIPKKSDSVSDLPLLEEPSDDKRRSIEV